MNELIVYDELDSVEGAILNCAGKNASPTDWIELFERFIDLRLHIEDMLKEARQ